VGALFFIIAILIALFPQNAIYGGMEALKTCANVIIPSLFPFFICTRVIIKTPISDKTAKLLSPIMGPLFNLNGYSSIAFFSGILSGYPQGAKAVVTLYEEGKCTKTECERMLAFCNNSGPLFIIGAVGAGILKSPALGHVLYIAHLLAAVTCGIIFRFYKRRDKNIFGKMDIFPKNKKTNFGIIFSESVSDSVITILIVCGYIVFMSVFLTLLEKIGAFFILEKYIFQSSPFSKGIIRGFFEVSLGVKTLGSVGKLSLLKLFLIGLCIGWGGLSVHFQSLGLIKGKFSPKTYFIGKALSGLFTGLYSVLILKIFPIAIKTSAGTYPDIKDTWQKSLALLAYYLVFMLSLRLISYIKEK